MAMTAADATEAFRKKMIEELTRFGSLTTSATRCWRLPEGETMQKTALEEVEEFERNDTRMRDGVVAYSYTGREIDAIILLAKMMARCADALEKYEAPAEICVPTGELR